MRTQKIYEAGIALSLYTGLIVGLPKLAYDTAGEAWAESDHDYVVADANSNIRALKDLRDNFDFKGESRWYTDSLDTKTGVPVQHVGFVPVSQLIVEQQQKIAAAETMPKMDEPVGVVAGALTLVAGLYLIQEKGLQLRDFRDTAAEALTSGHRGIKDAAVKFGKALPKPSFPSFNFKAGSARGA